MFRQILLTAALIGLAFGTPSTSKISPALLKAFQNRDDAKVNIFVEMREGNENILRRINSAKFSSRTERISTMKSELESLASTSQSGVISMLTENNFDFTSFWINNQVFIREASLDLLKKLVQDPQVSFIRQEEVYHISPLIFSNNTVNDEWGVEKIEAPQAWNLPGGNNGLGVVIASTDTGILHTHEALRSNYRNDNHSWYDPYDKSPTPIDLNGHGTLTMGIIVGTTGIGVAPGAQWITCRGCDTSSCSNEALTACGQWTVCPTWPDGSNADCSKAPLLSSNSWAGGQGQTNYLPIVNAWHTAGIIPIFGQGNDGPDCMTALSPADLENVIGVGSTDTNDIISVFSSRGPAVDGHIKPDISAPGSNVRSSHNAADDAYLSASGTSLATPHVAGVTALLLARDPNLSYVSVVDLLYAYADTNLGAADTCGNTPPTQFPNNIYGYGRLNARKSLEALIG